MFSLSAFLVAHRTVLARVDYNVPLEKGKVTDNRKIKESLPTLQYLLSQECKVIIATHLGRPEGRVVPELRLKLIARELQLLLPHQKVLLLKDCIGKEVQRAIEKGNKKDL